MDTIHLNKEDFEKLEAKRKELDDFLQNECKSDPFDNKLILKTYCNLDHTSFSFFVEKARKKCYETSLSVKFQKTNPFSSKE